MLQVVQAQLMSAPDTGALLADETFEGSGSGDRPIWGRRPGEGPDDTETDDDESDNHDDTESSGSGAGPIEIGKFGTFFFEMGKGAADFNLVLCISDQVQPGSKDVESKDAAGQLSVSVTSLLATLALSVLLSNRHELGTV